MKFNRKQYIAHYQIKSQFAAGSYGKVYHAVANSRDYAIKQIREPNKVRSRIRMDNEIKALTELNHPNIVKLYDVVRDNGYVYMVMEFCQYDLKEIIEKETFDENRALNILTQIAKGFKELNRLHIVHRDVKPANILLSNGLFKIADFGLVRYIQQDQQLLSTRVGTPYYMSPQILKNQAYTSKCDIWSLGIIFYQLLFSCLPWNATNQSDLIKCIYDNPIFFPKIVKDQTSKLLVGMLQIEQNNRIGWQQFFQILGISDSGDLQTVSSKQIQLSMSMSLLQQLMNVEISRMSIALFSRKFELLKGSQKNSVLNLVMQMFRPEYEDICLNAIKL